MGNLALDQKHTPPALPALQGKLICLTGKNRGKVFLITERRIVMGRGKECQVQVFDQKASREHAEIVKKDDSYIITDLGSQNGTIINDLKIKQYTLKNLDKIIIGQTVYKFTTDELPSSVTAISELATQNPAKDKSKKVQNSKRGPILVIVSMLLIAFLLMDDGSNSKPKKKRTTNINDEDVSEDIIREQLIKKKLSQDKELNEKLAEIFQRGLREYREGNYFRAINEFNLALILSPKHPKAEYYRDKTKQALDAEIEKYFIKGKRDALALRYKNSIVSYCAIMRLLQNYPNEERYKDAEQNIREVEKKMGLDEGEIKCF